jgi:hypothetical protein
VAFSPDVVEERLQRFAKEYGWKPEPHSIEEVDAATARLAPKFELVKDQWYQCGDLTKQERHFVANERAMCVASCLYFLTRYYYIKAKNRILRFTFRQGQWILWQMLCELDRMGVSKMLQIMKARQLGISTLCEGIARWASMFIPGVAAQIGSSDGQKSQIMLGMILLANEMLPPWLPPTETRSKTKSDRGLMEYEKIGSMIMIQHGAMRGGMGQGSTPTFVHLSELSQYTDPVKQLDEGLFKGLHEGPELIVLLESTADPSHKSSWWWKEQWIANRDNYWSGRAKFLPVFLPWHTTPELYPGDDWLHKFPMRADFKPHEDTIAHVRRAEAYVRTTKMLAKILGKDWTMPVEQQWFWQFNYDDHKRRKVEKSWFRQMPSDDYEALMGERDKIVGEETVEIMDTTKKLIADTPVYMLAGDGITEKYEPDESLVWYGDDSPPRLKCHWNTKRDERLEWMFVPLKPTIYHGMTDRERRAAEMTFDPLEKFLIWQEPQEGYDYSIGWDTGTGVGGDRSVVSVNRKGMSDSEPDLQVAEFASDSIGLQDICWWACAAAALYSKYMKDTPHNSPKIAIEMKRKYGDGPYHEAKLAGFRRWHEWGSNFDVKTWKEKVGKHGRVGWFTNEWSRPLLLSRFFGAVENGWYTVRSKWLAQEIAEMEQKVTDSGKTRADHEAGKHDDRVFAAAMSYFTTHQCDVMAVRMKHRYEQPQGMELEIEHGPAIGMQTVLSGGSLWPA